LTGPGAPIGAPESLATPPLAAVVGATASGKSDVALEVARTAMSQSLAGHGDATIELVSVDSMAVYRGMDIGTAKPTRAERGRVAYHLIDVVDPDQEFTVQQFQHAARAAVAGIQARGHGTILVGGTGLYLRSLVDDLTFPGRFPDVAASLAAGLDAAGPEGSAGQRAALALLHRRLVALDPVAAGRIEPTNRRRLLRALEVTVGSGRPFSSFGPGLERYPRTAVSMVGILHDPSVLDVRIAQRFERLMDLGFLDEVRALATRPGGLSRTARQALGYRELLSHIEEGTPLVAAIEEAVRRTRAFARRQMAWFRRDPRIVWMSADDDLPGSIMTLLREVPSDVATMGD